MEFDGYFWRLDFLDEIGLGDLGTALTRYRDPHEQKAAFAGLLNADQPAARGIALDHYSYAETRTRHSATNPFTEFDGEVLARSRESLTQSPITADVSGAKINGANHASALLAARHMVDVDDADAVAAVLRGGPGPDLLAAAAAAARTVLEKAPPGGAAHMLSAAIGSIALSAGFAADSRVALIRVLDGARSEHERALLRQALTDPDLIIQINAAWVLLDPDTDLDRDTVARVATGWPKDAPYPADEVLAILLEDPD